MQDKHRKLGPPFVVVKPPDARRPLSTIESKQYKEAYNLLAESWVLLTCYTKEEQLVEEAMEVIRELIHVVPETAVGSGGVGKTSGAR